MNNNLIPEYVSNITAIILLLLSLFCHIKEKQFITACMKSTIAITVILVAGYLIFGYYNFSTGRITLSQYLQGIPFSVLGIIIGLVISVGIGIPFALVRKYKDK